MLAPASPPPMMTQRACAGHSAGTGLPQPDGVARISRAVLESGEVPGGVCGVVELEFGDGDLDYAPHRLAEIGHDPHQPDTGEAPVSAGLTEIALQQNPVVHFSEVVVDGEIP